MMKEDSTFQLSSKEIVPNKRMDMTVPYICNSIHEKSSIQFLDRHLDTS